MAPAQLFPVNFAKVLGMHFYGKPWAFHFVEIFHFVKFSLHFVYIYRSNSNFLIKFYSSDPSFNINILTSLYLKFKISAHAHIAITHYYLSFTNFFTWYECETYIGDTFWRIKLLNDFINLITWLFLKMYSGL